MSFRSDKRKGAELPINRIIGMDIFGEESDIDVSKTEEFHIDVFKN
jgi:hypothetical protein